MAIRTIAAVSNPAWADAAHTCIRCMATFKEIGMAMPFSASASDPEPHGQALFAALVAGTYGAIAAYVPPPVPPSTAKPTINVAEP